MGSLKTLKQSIAKGGGSQFVKYIPKNGSMNVRFIQEPEEWVNYVEHFDAMLRKSYPCNGETNCPGCISGERKSSRYLANAVDRDDKNRVIPLQMPKDLANRLVVRYERNGTLTDRDFELSRQGEGLDTTYDLESGLKDGANIVQFTGLDLLQVLEEAYQSVFGNPAAEDEDEAPSSNGRTGAVKGRARSKAADAAEHDEDEAPKPARKKPAAKRAAKKAEPEPEFTPDDELDTDPDDDDEDPVAVDDDDQADDADVGDDEDDGYDEATLRAMPLGALRAVARNEFGVATKGKDQDALIEAIFAAGDSGDEDPPF